jgi:hypothetical protein
MSIRILTKRSAETSGSRISKGGQQNIEWAPADIEQEIAEYIYWRTAEYGMSSRILNMRSAETGGSRTPNEGQQNIE